MKERERGRERERDKGKYWKEVKIEQAQKQKTMKDDYFLCWLRPGTLGHSFYHESIPHLSGVGWRRIGAPGEKPIKMQAWESKWAMLESKPALGTDIPARLGVQAVQSLQEINGKLVAVERTCWESKLFKQRAPTLVVRRGLEWSLFKDLFTFLSCQHKDTSLSWQYRYYNPICN